MSGIQYQREAIRRALDGLPPDDPTHAIVRTERVQGALADFEKADSFALSAQARYRSWGRRGLQATTFGVLIGSIILFPLDSVMADWVRLSISALQTFALFITFGAMLFITWWKPLGEWMAHRAEAERLRGHVFEEILRATVPDAAPGSVAEGKLKLLLGAYINDQLDFFSRRALSLKRASGKRTAPHVVGYALIFIASALGAVSLLRASGVSLPGAFGEIIDVLAVNDANRWQLGIATMASGLLAYATARTLMDEDERKAALYDATAKKLRRLLKRDLATVTAAAATANDGPLRKLFEDARYILAQEHAVWSFIREDDDGIGAMTA